MKMHSPKTKIYTGFTPNTSGCCYSL